MVLIWLSLHLRPKNSYRNHRCRSNNRRFFLTKAWSGTANASLKPTPANQEMQSMPNCTTNLHVGHDRIGCNLVCMQESIESHLGISWQ